MLLDMSTLQFASMAGRLPFVLLFAVFCLRGASRPFHFWTASICASCLGMMLIFGSRHVHQMPALYGALAYALMGMSIVLYQAGGETFFDGRIRRPGLLALGLTPGLLYLAGRLGEGNIYATMVPVVSALALLCLRAMLVFLTRQREGDKRLIAQLIVAGALGAYALVLLATATIILAHLASGTVYDLSPSPEAILPLVVDQSANMLINVGIITMSLERAQNHMRRAAATDVLTGLANRRGVLERAGPLLGLVRRKKHPLSVLVVDIDHFKEVNDVNGHDAGDAVLAEFAARMRQVLRRQNDILGRWGGEEFVAVLPGQSEAEAQRLGELLRAAVDTSPFPAGDRGIAITVSIGVAQLEPEDDHLERIVARADAALYAAKRGGRNRVAVNRETGLPSLADTLPGAPPRPLPASPS